MVVDTSVRRRYYVYLYYCAHNLNTVQISIVESKWSLTREKLQLTIEKMFFVIMKTNWAQRGDSL